MLLVRGIFEPIQLCGYYRIIALFGACASTRVLAHAPVSGDTCPLSSAARNYSNIGAPTDLVTPGKSFPLKETIWSNHQHGNLVSKQNRFNPNDSIMKITMFSKTCYKEIYIPYFIPLLWKVKQANATTLRYL